MHLFKKLLGKKQSNKGVTALSFTSDGIAIAISLYTENQKLSGTGYLPRIKRFELGSVCHAEVHKRYGRDKYPVQQSLGCSVVVLGLITARARVQPTSMGTRQAMFFYYQAG